MRQTRVYLWLLAGSFCASCSSSTNSFPKSQARVQPMWQPSWQLGDYEVVGSSSDRGLPSLGRSIAISDQTIAMMNHEQVFFAERPRGPWEVQFRYPHAGYAEPCIIAANRQGTPRFAMATDEDTRAITVFERSVHGWGVSAHIPLPPDASELLGCVIAMHDEFLVASSMSTVPKVSPANLEPIEVYRKTSAGWVHTQSLRPPVSPHQNSDYAASMVLSAKTLAVLTRPNSKWARHRQAAIDIYELNDSWAWTQRILVEDGAQASVALSDDTMALGSPLASKPESDSGENPSEHPHRTGKVWIFERGADGWKRSDELLPPGHTETRGPLLFGHSVALQGGCVYATMPGFKRLGALLEFCRNQAGAWGEPDVLVGPSRSDGHRRLFGSALDIDYPLIAVSNDWPENAVPGQVYVFESLSE